MSTMISAESGDLLITETADNLITETAQDLISRQACRGVADFSESTARKPRFTADPTPPQVDTDPSLVAWLQDQFQRIDDWWPKDLEDRLAELERLYPFAGGTWTMVDYSSILIAPEGVWEEYQAFESVMSVYSITGDAISTGCWSGFDALGSIGVPGGGQINHVYGDDGDGRLWLNYSGGVGWTDDGSTYNWITTATLGLSTSHTPLGFWKDVENGVYYVAGIPSGYVKGIHIVKSTDLASWSTVVNDPTPDNTTTPSQVVAINNGKDIIVPCRGNSYGTGSTNDTYVHYSNDYGLTWNNTGVLISSYQWRPTSAHTANGVLYWCGTKGQVWRSTNGSSWGNVLVAAPSNQFINATCVSGNGDTTVLVGMTGSGTGYDYIWRSTNNGASFAHVATLTPSTTSSLDYSASCGWGFVSGTWFRNSTNDGVTWNTTPGSWSSLIGIGVWDRPIGA